MTQHVPPENNRSRISIRRIIGYSILMNAFVIVPIIFHTTHTHTHTHKKKKKKKKKRQNIFKKDTADIILNKSRSSIS